MSTILKSVVSALFLVLSPVALSAASAEQGPFANDPLPTTLHRTVIDWLDNVSVGAVQTTIGAGHVIVSMIANPISGREFPVPQFRESNHGQQLVVSDALTINGVGYSLGLFNLGPVAGQVAWHEAGHSQQSAVLGPLYLPTVLLDYLVEAAAGRCFPYSCGHEFIERWADLEGENYAKMPFTKSVRVGAGFIRKNDVTLPVLVLDLALDERFDAADSKVRVQKFYEWLKSEVMVPLVQTQGRLPLFFEVDLLRKTELTDVKIADGLKVRLNIEQNYGKGSYDPATGALRFDALEFSPGVGVDYELGGGVQVFATASGTVSATAIKPLDQDSLVTGSKLASLGAGGRVLAGVTIWDFASLYARFGKEWLLGIYEKSSEEVGLTNMYRSPRNKMPAALNYFDFGAKYLHEKVDAATVYMTPARSTDIHSFFLTLGGRF